MAAQAERHEAVSKQLEMQNQLNALHLQQAHTAVNAKRLAEVEQQLAAERATKITTPGRFSESRKRCNKLGMRLLAAGLDLDQ